MLTLPLSVKFFIVIMIQFLMNPSASVSDNLLLEMYFNFIIFYYLGIAATLPVPCLCLTL